MATNGTKPAPKPLTRQIGGEDYAVDNINGKAYAPVPVRVQSAHKHGGYTMVRCEFKEIFDIKVCEVEIIYNEQHFIGTAEVKLSFGFPISDAQTSAVGRALGFAGFDIERAIASAEDMEAVARQRGQSVVEAEPAVLPEPGLKEELGQMAHRLNYTKEEFKAFLYSYTNPETGKVALQAAYNALEQEQERRAVAS